MRKVLLFVLGTTAAFGQAVHGGIDATARLNVKAQPFTIELPNSSTGTTLYKLAKTVMNAGVLQAQITTTSSADQAAAIGCVVGGAGTSGNALIMIAGTGSCYFDAATTAGHIAVPSSTTAGTLHDSGSTSSPSSGEVMATVGATNACSSAPCLIAGNLFMTPDIIAQGSGGNGGGNGGGPNKVTPAQLIRTCEIIIGDPGAASSALANDNDSPDVCTNDSGATMTITAVHCYADAGSPTVTPIITGGSGTSILSGALTCSQTAGGAAGTLNGTPTQTNGQSIDANITTAGGTAKYAVIRITRTLPTN